MSLAFAASSMVRLANRAVTGVLEDRSLPEKSLGFCAVDGHRAFRLKSVSQGFIISGFRVSELTAGVQTFTFQACLDWASSSASDCHRRMSATVHKGFLRRVSYFVLRLRVLRVYC